MNIQALSSLRARLMLLVLLGAIPILFLLIYTGLELRDHAADEARQDAMHIVAMVSNEQKILVTQTRQFLSVLAQTPQIQNDDAASCNRFLAKLLGETSTYANLGVIGLNGDIGCSALPMNDKVNVSDRPYFQRTLKSRDFSIGDYQIGRITNTTVLVFSYPVFDNRQQLKAILFAARPLNWLTQHATELAMQSGSIINVVDHATHTLLAQHPQSPVQVGASVEKTALVEAIHASSGTGTAKIIGPDGVKRLHSFTYLPDLPHGKEIHISLGISVKEIYATSNAVMFRNLGTLSFVILLMLLIAWYGSSTLVLRQITGLLAATRRLAAGNLDAQVEVADSNNEVAQLGREFNQMAVALRQRDTEARRADELLQKSENDLRNAIETVPDIIYMASASDFAATFVSPALTRILGFTPEEFITDPGLWSASIHDEDRERVLEQIKSVLANSEHGFSIEYRMWHKDGKTLRWFEDRPHINRDTAGLATEIHGVMTDITERKQAKKLSTRMGRILEDSWDEIYIFDAVTLHFIDVSNGACQNLGYSMEELAHLTPLDIKPDISADQFEAVLGPLHRDEKPQVSFETRHQRKDGSYYPVQIRLQLSSNEIPMVFIAIMQDISERKQYIEELEHNASHDKLTGLPNRFILQDRLQHELQVAHRDALPLAVLAIDIMRLREVNDIIGHDAGDFVLREVARRMQAILRQSDTIARMGGDEFAIVLPNVSMKQAPVTASKIQKLFEQPIVIEGTSVEVEAAIGIALYPEHGDGASILLQHAEIAMHAAKYEAEVFCIYRPEENKYSLRRLTLLGELRQAIEQKELALYYQPQIDLKLGCITSVEALARWPHPTEGMISPDDFIPLIEQSGLIQPFTLWVLEEAITQIKRWSEAGIELTVAVNLSTRNLLDTELPSNITNLLKHYNVDAAHLMLEVTESAVMSQPETAMKILMQLHERGLNLSIDDFGTGYSSLAYLKKLPVQELKIDQSFVFGLITDEDDAVIVRSTIDLAHNMGLKVVAEGVENQEVMDMTALLRCDIAQGYHMGRPLPVEDLERWLMDSPWGIQQQERPT